MHETELGSNLKTQSEADVTVEFLKMKVPTFLL